MGESLARELGQPLGRAIFERFPDGELHVVLSDEVAGTDVVLVQSLVAPVGDKLLELVLLADACRRAGAKSVTAALPYFAYSRQDRSTRMGEALGGEVLARLVSTAGFSRIATVDLHSEAAQGWFAAPLEHLTATSALAEAVRPFLAPGSVVVSPDLGGSRRAERVASALKLPLAVLHKTRHSGHEVAIHEVLGDVRGKSVVLVDDMISTGGTLVAAVNALGAAGCAPNPIVLATHALLVERATERLAHARIGRLVHTDSVPGPGETPFPRIVVPVAPLFAQALRTRLS